MREAYRGLSTRGRAFIAAGLTAVVCSMLFSIPGLTGAGILLLMLPLLTVAWVGTGGQQIVLTRTLSSPVASVGQPVDVHLTLRNTGPRAHGVLLAEDAVPFALGAQPRFVVEELDHNLARNLSYQIRSDVRGRFLIGPMTARISDGFGLVELTRTFTQDTAVIITPRPVPLPVIGIGGNATSSGDVRPRAFAAGSAEDVTVRDYRRGDDLRRVHWRSTARMDQLMVRREETPWQARATIWLDNRTGSHTGSGSASSLEYAVTAAASVAAHLIRLGYATRLVTATGVEKGTGYADNQGTDRAMLEALAMVSGSASPTLDLGWLEGPESGGLVIAVFGRLHDTDSRALRRVASSSNGCGALVVDVDGRGAESDAAGHRTAVLTGQGWRAADAGRCDHLERAWRELGAASRSRAELGSTIQVVGS